MNVEFEKVYKKVVMAYSEVLFQHLRGGSKKNRLNNLRIVGAPTSIRTGHIPNTSQEHYRVNQPGGY
jgi:hypothetical protein